jgi:hypothetical protein
VYPAIRLSGMSIRQKYSKLIDSVDSGAPETGIVQINPTVKPWDARKNGGRSEF